MAVKINNINRSDNLVLLDRCPQIMDFNKDSDKEVKTICRIEVNESASSGSRLVINGNVVTATDDINKSIGNKFYCKSNTFRIAVALCEALNNISNLVKDYDIYCSQSNVYIVSRQGGSDYKIVIDENECGYFTDIKNSTNSSTYLNKFFVDIYSLDNEGNKEYSATLQKVNNDISKSNVRFNLSNVLQGLSKYDELSKIDCNIYSINGVSHTTYNDTYVLIFGKGYYANHGKTYLNLSEDKLLYNNNYPYYVYFSNIYVSTYLDGLTLLVSYKFSDDSIIDSENIPINKGVNKIEFNKEYYDKCYFIDISVEGYSLRYIKINPPYAQGEYTRIFWHNSYGGINIFDFVGDKTIQRENDIITYYNSDLNFYDVDSKIGNEVIKDISLSEKITLTTHLMDENEMQILEDLRLSEDVWVEEDGKRYRIIITNITYTKVNNNFATANVTFRYSLTNFN